MLGLASGTELRLAAYGALLAAIVGWLLWHDHKLIADHDAQLRATGMALKAEAEQRIADLTTRHATEVSMNEVKLNEALQSNSALNDSLDQRVRDFQAYRRSHPDLPRPSSGPSAAVSGECGAESCGELAGRALQDSEQLARSLGEVVAALRNSQRDRDSLTGLP